MGVTNFCLIRNPSLLMASSEPKKFAGIVMLVTGTGNKIVYRFGRARGVRGRRPHAEGPYVADAMSKAGAALGI